MRGASHVCVRVGGLGAGIDDAACASLISRVRADLEHEIGQLHILNDEQNQAYPIEHLQIAGGGIDAAFSCAACRTSRKTLYETTTRARFRGVASGMWVDVRGRDSISKLPTVQAQAPASPRSRTSAHARISTLASSSGPHGTSSPLRASCDAEPTSGPSAGYAGGQNYTTEYTWCVLMRANPPSAPLC